MHKKILILDFGSQYSQLIARRVREAHVYCELHPWDMTAEAIREFNPAGIILSGGPNSVYEEETPKAPQIVFELGVPVLGICYGMQTMAAQLGGAVESGKVREFGYAEIRAHGHSKLFAGIQDKTNVQGHGLLDVWMSHGDKVTALPPGFSVIASNETTPIAAMADEARRFYAVQFHPEVTHTYQGKALLARFVHDICGCGQDWNMPDYIGEAVEKIRAQVGSEEVILGLSGGVDSSVAAALLHRAIGAQLTCVFVDNGLLRLNEAAQVMETFAKNLGVKVIHVDASAEFMKHLVGVSDPEQKRKIIGREFVEVFQRESAKLQAGQVAGAGYHLSRRDRICRSENQEGAYHQVAPQRRRFARHAAPQIAGTVARIVQGRSARTRRSARPAARHGVPPSLPRPRLGRAHPGRSEA